MLQTKNVHLQFADYFGDEAAFPYFYLLSKKLSEGSICIDTHHIHWEQLKQEDNLPDMFVSGSLDKLKKSPLVSEDDTKQPLVLSGNKLYLQRYFLYETRVIERIQAMINNENTQEAIHNLNKVIDDIRSLFADNNTGSTDWQAVAAITAVLNKFTIITGGPGTGKTTTIARILSLLYKIHPEMKVALCAPTGKAAARMAESLKNTAHNFPKLKSHFEKLEPSTIHRLLGSIKGSINFKHNADNPLKYDLLIVDESSMLDVALFAKFLDAVNPNSRLILLGDKNQLAAVEAGSLFGDLCLTQPELNRFSRQKAELINGLLNNSTSHILSVNIAESMHPLFEHIIELKHSYRFSDDGGIGKFSRAVIQNQTEKLEDFFHNKDSQVSIDTDYSGIVFEEFALIFADFIKEKDIDEALKKLNRIRILCAIREGEEGMYALNKKVERYLHAQGLINSGSEFYENRPLMITGNNYELGLFNGDTGIVRNGRVWFENKDQPAKSFLPASLDAVETVFAMTIHKSQGSEFDNVLVVLPEKYDIPILTAELLYTAVTRAKTRVCVQSSKESILACAGRRVERSSGIIDRMNN